MKDIVTPVPPEEVKGVIRKCLEQAAQLNYQRIKDYAKIEGKQTQTAHAYTSNCQMRFTKKKMRLSVAKIKSKSSLDASPSPACPSFSSDRQTEESGLMGNVT